MNDEGLADAGAANPFRLPGLHPGKRSRLAIRQIAGGVYIDVRGSGIYPHSATGKETNMTATKGLVVPAGGGKHLDMSAPGRFAALKLLGHETNESIMLFEETVPVGTKSLFHLHRDSDEVAWVLAGEITFQIGDEVTVGGPGTCAFFPRNVPHAWKNTGSETGRVVFLYAPAAAGGYVEELLNCPGPINDDERNKLRERYRWEVVGPNPLLRGRLCSRRIEPPEETTMAATLSTWTIDPGHSSVEFSLDYMGFSTYRTGFRALEGSLEFDATRPDASSVTASIPVASVDVTSDRLMSRLMDPDLLGGKDHPTITFKSTRVEALDPAHWQVAGDLNIQGVAH